MSKNPIKDETYLVAEKNIAIHQYYTKDANVDGEYHDLKKSYSLNRGEIWIPRNKRPDKIRDALKLFEEALKVHDVLCLDWKNCFLQVLPFLLLLIIIKLIISVFVPYSISNTI